MANVSNINDIPIGGDTFDGQFTKSFLTVFNDVNIASGGETAEVSLANYLPNDGHYYEIQCAVWAKTPATTGATNHIWIDGSLLGALPVYQRSVTGEAAEQHGNTIIVAKSTSNLKLTNTGAALAVADFRLYGYKRLGTNNDSNNYISNIEIPNNSLTVGGNNFNGEIVANSLTIFSGTTLVSSSGIVKADLSSYLPDNTATYAVQVVAYGRTATNTTTTSNYIVGVYNSNNEQFTEQYIMMCRMFTTGTTTQQCEGSAWLVVPPTHRYVGMRNATTTGGGAGLTVINYRRLGTNE